MGKKAVEIRLLGELEVTHDGRACALPASKKTRALLAYLVATARPHLRERLCALLWDGPDDPRAALRWSLTKIRPLLDDAAQVRLACDRDRVAFATEGISVDVSLLRGELAGGVESASTEILRGAAGRFRGEFLEGLDLSGCYRYHEWCVGERESLRALRVAILVALTHRLSDQPEEALAYARERVAIDPLAEAAHVAVIRALGKLGRTREAQQQYESCRRILEAELGARASNELEQARMALGRSATEPAAKPAVAQSPVARAPVLTPVAHPAATDSTIRAPFVGRQVQRDAFVAAVEAARAGVADQLLLVVGDPGIGKSRLLESLADDVRAAGGVTLRGRAFEAELVRPYGAWIDALRSVNVAATATTWAADLAPLLPELGGKPDDGNNRNRLFDAVTRLLGSLADQGGSLVVILDDIQWLDEASAALLHFAVRALAGTRVLFACGARGGELGDNRAALKVIRALERDRRLQQHRLAALDAAETAQLVRALHPDADPARVFAGSEGNPLFALEIAHALTGEGRPVSVTLEGLMDQRLAQLDDRSRELLPWAAALGRAFSPDQLAGVTGMALPDLLPALENLERHGVVRVAGEGYDFAHDLLRQAAYRQLSNPRRRLVHLQIARVLQAQATPDGVLAGDIAHHAAQGGDAALAARAYVRAGERCLELFANAEAAELAMRGIQHLARLERLTRLPLHIALLSIYIFSGRARARMRETDAELLRVIMDAQDAGLGADVARGFHARSLLQFTTENAAGARDSTMQAAAAVRSSGDPLTSAMQLSDSARCLLLIERDIPQAQVLLAEAVQLVGARASELLNISWARGLMHSFLGETDRAMDSLQRALSQAARDQSHWEEYTCLANLITTALDGDRAPLALAHCDRLREVAAKMIGGSEPQVAAALEALARAGCGQADAADLDRVAAEVRKVDAKNMLAYTLNATAELELRAGNRDQARARATEALAAATAVGRPSQIAGARAVLGRIALLEGDVRAAQGHLEATAGHRRQPLVLAAHAHAKIDELEDLLSRRTTHPTATAPKGEPPDALPDRRIPPRPAHHRR